MTEHPQTTNLSAEETRHFKNIMTDILDIEET
jgi:hypothetical protein